MKFWFSIFLFITYSRIAWTDGVVEEEQEPAAPQVEAAISEEEQLQFASCREKSDSWVYQSDVSQMMKIIVNNLYQRKDVFLRELISNAFDALDKARFAGINNPEVLAANPDMDIRIRIDPVNRLLIITDTGIGMTKEELIKNLGTIARSGTKEFINKLSQQNEKAPELWSQIGQFGVGFYSAFLVADRVLVASKSYDEEKQYIFEANTTSFNVYEDPRGDTLKRGTSIILYMNQESSEYLKEDKIIGLVEKYSEFISFPIYIYSNQDEQKKEVPYYWRHINDVAPLWMRTPSNITKDEYESFYNVLSYGRKKEKYGKPYGVVHFVAEGETNFRALLFIPDKLDDTYVNAPMSWKPKVKLYVRRVLIDADTQRFLPHYLGYIVGIVDSEDLPLNVGREMPQHSELIKVINKKLTRKVLDHIKKMVTNDPEEYERFYEEFGNALKSGIFDDETNHIRIAKLLRFYSTRSPEKMISLEDYVKNMKPGQPGVFFIPCASIAEADKSPYMERVKIKGYEVLYMLENIDEAVMQHLRVYDNHPLTNIAKEMADFPQSKTEESKLKEKAEEFRPLLTWMKKHLKSRVAAVRLSSRLVSSSCILIAPEDGYSGNMEKIVRSQSYVHGKVSGIDSILSRPKNLELNPYHPLVKSMLARVEEDPESEQLKEDTEVCLSIGTLSGGYAVTDGVQLSNLIESLYLKHINVSPEDISDKIHEELGLDEEAPLPSEDSESEEDSSEEDRQQQTLDDLKENIMQDAQEDSLQDSPEAQVEREEL